MFDPQNAKIIEKPKSEPVYNMLRLETSYSVTINPNDSQQGLVGSMKLEGRFVKMHNYYRKLFGKMDRCGITVVMYPEISNPKNATSYPRYHFHGTVIFRTVNSLLGWYEVFMPLIKRKAMLDIDTIDDPNHWDKYCQKNREIMEPIHNKLEINYPTFETYKEQIISFK